MHRRLSPLKLAMATSLALGGCSTLDFYPQRSKMVLEDISNKPVAEVFNNLGPPDGRAAVDGKTYYSWKHDDGYTSLSEPKVYIPLSCKLTVRVGPDDIVETGAFRGDRGACYYFLNYLP